jgi:hypothetical protein
MSTIWGREYQDLVLCFDTSHKLIASIFETVDGHLFQVIMFFILNRFNTVVEKARNLLHIGWHFGVRWVMIVSSNKEVIGPL